MKLPAIINTNFLYALPASSNKVESLHPASKAIFKFNPSLFSAFNTGDNLLIGLENPHRASYRSLWPPIMATHHTIEVEEAG